MTKDNRPIMACGHRGEFLNHATGKWFCAFCVDDGDKEIPMPNLEGRQATCRVCGTRHPSSYDLDSFKFKPQSDTDEFYDGCLGWE